MQSKKLLKVFERKPEHGTSCDHESVMMDAMFEVPSDDNVKECIYKRICDGEEQPKLITQDDEVKMLPKKKGKKESDKKDEIA